MVKHAASAGATVVVILAPPESAAAAASGCPAPTAAPPPAASIATAPGGPIAQFADDWLSGLLGLPVTAARSEAVFLAYRAWAHVRGLRFVPQPKAFVPLLAGLGVVHRRRLRWIDPRSGRLAQSMVIVPNCNGQARPADVLGLELSAFEDGLKVYREAVRHG
jgi:hypothetical protein